MRNEERVARGRSATQFAANMAMIATKIINSKKLNDWKLFSSFCFMTSFKINGRNPTRI
jgi:hypothetical protein